MGVTGSDYVISTRRLVASIIVVRTCLIAKQMLTRGSDLRIAIRRVMMIVKARRHASQQIADKHEPSR
jgi:hypothetical protein